MVGKVKTGGKGTSYFPILDGSRQERPFQFDGK